jgi:flavin reductase (DIM6/NTAB) family NADH-FMN oxidoreductase RutF
MSKVVWKPGTMLYPVPAVMVTAKNGDAESIITIAWAGTICSNPPMVSISIRPDRYSYNIIKDSGEFVINVPGKDLAFAADFCGVKSGRDVNKFEFLKLNREKASVVNVPLIKEAPLSIECKVKNIIELGSHHMFIADVVAVNVESSLIDENGKLHLNKANLICYSHGEYRIASNPIGSFGFSVRKKNTSNKK